MLLVSPLKKKLADSFVGILSYARVIDGKIDIDAPHVRIRGVLNEEHRSPSPNENEFVSVFGERQHELKEYRSCSSNLFSIVVSSRYHDC